VRFLVLSRTYPCHDTFVDRLSRTKTGTWDSKVYHFFIIVFIRNLVYVIAIVLGAELIIGIHLILVLLFEVNILVV
jgi:hypothetical protein